MSPSRIEAKTIANARSLRKNMGEAETKLWRELRDFKRHFGLHVRKQAPIRPYIADFAILTKRLVIEVDGHQHQFPAQMKHDQKRDAWLNSQGFKILRFSTGELSESFDGCVEEIMREVGVQ